MTSALHIIGAIIISGAIVALILSVNYSMQIESTESVADAKVQSDADLLTSILQDEFKKIGSGMNSTWEAFGSEQSDEGRLAYHMRINDALIFVELFLLPDYEAENDTWMLMRIQYSFADSQTPVYNRPVTLMKNITQFEFIYYDGNQERTYHPDNSTRFIGVNATLQSKEPVDGEYLYSVTSERFLLRQLHYMEF